MVSHLGGASFWGNVALPVLVERLQCFINIIEYKFRLPGSMLNTRVADKMHITSVHALSCICQRFGFFILV